MKTPEKDNLTIYLLDIGECDQLVWCNDPDPGAGMNKDDAVGPYYHASLLKDDKWLADNGLVRVISMADMNLDAIQDMVFDAIEDQE